MVNWWSAWLINSPKNEHSDFWWNHTVQNQIAWPCVVILRPVGFSKPSKPSRKAKLNGAEEKTGFLSKIKRNPEKSGFGVQGVWGAILIVNFIERLAQKLCRIILLHFGLVTFMIHFRNPRKPSIFMVFGPIGRDHDSQNSDFWAWDTKRFQIVQEQSPKQFWGILCVEIQKNGKLETWK